MVYKFFDKKSKGSGIFASLAYKSANEPNYQLANELNKPIVRKFWKRKVYSSFTDNILGVDLADMYFLVANFNIRSILNHVPDFR